MKRKLLLALTILFIDKVVAQKVGGLKDAYAKYFPIGVAVSVKNVLDKNDQAFIVKHFNSITTENAMKMGAVHPLENRYYWKDADSIVNFAIKNKLKIRGHNLCWHQNAPNWLFYDEQHNLVSKEVLLARLKDHIFNVVGRYKGKIYAWDVVNEAVDDDDRQFLRNSLWYQIAGEDFIVKAFEYAHEADPKAILFYNEYSTEKPGKRERVYKLLKKLVDAKVPINAIGIQAHYSIYTPSPQDLITSIEKFASLGLKVQITELDMSVFNGKELSLSVKPEEAGMLPPAIEQQQADRYAEIFKVFRDYKNVITGVTFWNLSDKDSWLDNFPVKERKSYPLLFDTNNQPKKAYWSVVDF
ncbi:MAG: endo-1,4-beta-xylanase [Mucilaginibacter sp.]|nr:endo-1,4-beta-xylanase [Mucilaginibacter sp.]